MNLFEHIYDKIVLLEDFKSMSVKYLTDYKEQHPDATEADIDDFEKRVKDVLNQFKTMKNAGVANLKKAGSLGITRRIKAGVDEKRQPIYVYEPFPEDINFCKGIDNYWKFEDLEKIVTYVNSQRETLDASTKEKEGEKTVPTIVDNEIFTIWQCVDKESCITVKPLISELPYEWCICRNDASNYFNVYRYKQGITGDFGRQGAPDSMPDNEPTFYFVKIKDRTAEELEHWYNLPESTRRSLDAIADKLEDRYHCMVIRVRKDGILTDPNLEQYGFSTAANTGDIKLSWKQIVMLEPRLKDLQALLRPEPLTPLQKENYRRFRGGLTDADFEQLEYKDILAYIDIYPNPSLQSQPGLTDRQFAHCPDPLKNHYINQRIALSKNQYNEIKNKPMLLKRYTRLAQQKADTYLAVPARDVVFKATEIMVLDDNRIIQLLSIFNASQISLAFANSENPENLAILLINFKKENLTSDIINTIFEYCVSNIKDTQIKRKNFKTIVTEILKYKKLDDRLYNNNRLLWSTLLEYSSTEEDRIWYTDKMYEYFGNKICDNTYIMILQLQWSKDSAEFRKRLFNNILNARRNTVGINLATSMLNMFTTDETEYLSTDLTKDDKKQLFKFINLLLKQSNSVIISDNYGNSEIASYKISGSLFEHIFKILTPIYSKEQIDKMVIKIIKQKAQDFNQFTALSFLRSLSTDIRTTIVPLLLKLNPEIFTDNFIANIMQLIYGSAQKAYEIIIEIITQVKNKITDNTLYYMLKQLQDGYSTQPDENENIQQLVDSIFAKCLDVFTTDRLTAEFGTYYIRSMGNGAGKQRPIDILLTLQKKNANILSIDTGSNMLQILLYNTKMYWSAELPKVFSQVVDLYGPTIKSPQIYYLFTYASVNFKLINKLAIQILNLKQHLILEEDVLVMLRNFTKLDSKWLDAVSHWIPKYAILLTRLIKNDPHISGETKSSFLTDLETYVKQTEVIDVAPKKRRTRKTVTPKPEEPKEIKPEDVKEVKTEESVNIFDQMFDNIILLEDFHTMKKKWMEDYIKTSKTIHGYDPSTDDITKFEKEVNQYLAWFKIIKNNPQMKEIMDDVSTPRINIQAEIKDIDPTTNKPKYDSEGNVVYKIAPLPRDLNFRRDVDKYRKFDTLKMFVDYIRSRRPLIPATKKEDVKAKGDIIVNPPIYEDDKITIWYGADKEMCIAAREQMPLLYEWCVCRPGSLNMYNAYRYVGYYGEPTFYFIQNKARTKLELEHWNSLPEMKNNPNISFAQKIKDRWHQIVLQVRFSDPTESGRSKKINYVKTSALNDGDNSQSWESIIQEEPLLAPHKELFKHVPLTEQEKKDFQRFSRGMEDNIFFKLPWEDKQKYIDIFPTNGNRLRDQQFIDCDETLKNHYINKNVGLTIKQYLAITENKMLMRRYAEMAKRKAEEYIKFPNNFYTFLESEIIILDENLQSQLFSKFTLNALSGYMNNAQINPQQFVQQMFIHNKDTLSAEMLQQILFAAQKSPMNSDGTLPRPNVKNMLKIIDLILNTYTPAKLIGNLHSLSLSPLYYMIKILPLENAEQIKDSLEVFKYIETAVANKFEQAHIEQPELVDLIYLNFMRYIPELANQVNAIYTKVLKNTTTITEPILLQLLELLPKYKEHRKGIIESLFKRLLPTQLNYLIISKLLSYSLPENRVDMVFQILKTKKETVTGDELNVMFYNLMNLIVSQNECFKIQMQLWKEIKTIFNNISLELVNKLLENVEYGVFSYDQSTQLFNEILNLIPIKIDMYTFRHLSQLYGVGNSESKKWQETVYPILLDKLDIKYLQDSKAINDVFSAWLYVHPTPHLLVDMILEKLKNRSINSTTLHNLTSYIQSYPLGKTIEAKTKERLDFLKKLIDIQDVKINYEGINFILHSLEDAPQEQKKMAIYIIHIKGNGLTEDDIATITGRCFLIDRKMQNLDVARAILKYKPNLITTGKYPFNIPELQPKSETKPGDQLNLQLNLPVKKGEIGKPIPIVVDRALESVNIFDKLFTQILIEKQRK